MRRNLVQIAKIRMCEAVPGDVVNRIPEDTRGWFEVAFVETLFNGKLQLADAERAVAFSADPLDIVGVQLLKPIDLPVFESPNADADGAEGADVDGASGDLPEASVLEDSASPTSASPTSAAPAAQAAEPQAPAAIAPQPVPEPAPAPAPQEAGLANTLAGKLGPRPS